MTKGGVTRASPEPTDEDLLGDFRSGDADAFDVLYHRYWGRTVRFARRMLGSQQDAEDLCAEAFCTLLLGASAFRSVRAALFTIVHRRCIDVLRRRRRRQGLLRWFRPTEPLAPPADPEHTLLLDEATTALNGALLALSPEHRAVVSLYYGDGLSASEVGAIVGLNEAQVWSKLSYARRLLRTQLSDEEAP